MLSHVILGAWQSRGASGAAESGQGHFSDVTFSVAPESSTALLLLAALAPIWIHRGRAR
jgi:hypothetical protein